MPSRREFLTAVATAIAASRWPLGVCASLRPIRSRGGVERPGRPPALEPARVPAQGPGGHAGEGPGDGFSRRGGRRPVGTLRSRASARRSMPPASDASPRTWATSACATMRRARLPRRRPWARRGSCARGFRTTRLHPRGHAGGRRRCSIASARRPRPPACDSRITPTATSSCRRRRARSSTRSRRHRSAARRDSRSTSSTPSTAAAIRRGSSRRSDRA